MGNFVSAKSFETPASPNPPRQPLICHAEDVFTIFPDRQSHGTETPFDNVTNCLPHIHPKRGSLAWLTRSLHCTQLLRVERNFSLEASSTLCHSRDAPTGSTIRWHMMRRLDSLPLSQWWKISAESADFNVDWVNNSLTPGTKVAPPSLVQLWFREELYSSLGSTTATAESNESKNNRCGYCGRPYLQREEEKKMRLVFGW